jgi:hypothetical protein
VQNPVLDITKLVLQDDMSDNASGADNQQERLSIDRIPVAIGNFLSGFALGEGSFMIVCRPRVDYRRGWKLSAAFNVSLREHLNRGGKRRYTMERILRDYTPNSSSGT